MPTTRRQALTVAAAASVPLLAGAPPALAQSDDDRGLLEGLLRLERDAEQLYEALGGAIGEPFAEHQTVHVDVLTKELEAIGGQAPPAGAEPKTAASEENAAALENRMLRAYYEAVPALSRSRLVQIAASIMLNHGQHLVVLREALRRPPVPNAFEDGSRPR